MEPEKPINISTSTLKMIENRIAYIEREIESRIHSISTLNQQIESHKAMQACLQSELNGAVWFLENATVYNPDPVPEKG